MANGKLKIVISLMSIFFISPTFAESKTNVETRTYHVILKPTEKMKSKLTLEQIEKQVLAETGIYYVHEFNNLGKASIHKEVAIEATPGKSITCFPTNSPPYTSTGCAWVVLGDDTNITLELYLTEHTPEYDDDSPD